MSNHSSPILCRMDWYLAIKGTRRENESPFHRRQMNTLRRTRNWTNSLTLPVLTHRNSNWTNQRSAQDPKLLGFKSGLVNRNFCLKVRFVRTPPRLKPFWPNTQNWSFMDLSLISNMTTLRILFIPLSIPISFKSIWEILNRTSFLWACINWPQTMITFLALWTWK